MDSVLERIDFWGDVAEEALSSLELETDQEARLELAAEWEEAQTRIVALRQEHGLAEPIPSE